MTHADRDSQAGRGEWKTRVMRKRPPPAEAKPPEVEPEPTGRSGNW